MRCTKSRFKIRIIVFDELELIIFVSQGLTLSTASLVYIALLTDYSVLYDAMAKSNRQDWFVWNTNVSEFAKSCLSELTVNIEHKGVLDRLERHEGVQRLAPQGPPVISNARPKLKQGEIIFLKSSQIELNNNDATQSTN